MHIYIYIYIYMRPSKPKDHVWYCKQLSKTKMIKGLQNTKVKCTGVLSLQMFCFEI